MLEIRWRCRDGVALAPRPDDDALELAVDGSEPVRVALRSALAQGLEPLNRGMSEAAIAAAGGSDYSRIALLFRLVGQLRRGGVLVADLYGGERRLATLRPLDADFELPSAAAPPRQGARWHVSRFALLRREGRCWVLECTEAACDVVLEDPDVVLWLHDAAAAASASASVRLEVLSLLARLGFLEEADAAEEEPASRRMWEFHDRLLHTRSRASRGLRPIGGTYRFRAPSADDGMSGPPLRRAPGADDTPTLPSPPALRAPYDGETIALPVPAPGPSRPLDDVMEQRRSLRSMGDPPVSLAQVAALLYRVARVTAYHPGDLIRRPYPSGGSRHELEFYLAVRECRGLAAGFYHYRGDAHALTRLPSAAAAHAAAAMIDDCAWAWGQPERPPQCLLVMASRLPRVAWKYEGIAYRVSLMGAGVVVQSLYLVATDLGLHGCAAGTGNPALFAQATGMSTWTETSVAEFGFGSRPAGT